MKNTIFIALIALALAGCSSAQSVAFQTAIANFNANVEVVDASIARSSNSLAKNCSSIESFAQALAALPRNHSSTAAASLAGANAGIVAWCQAPPSNIKSAIVTTAAVANAAREAYKAARAGN